MPSTEGRRCFGICRACLFGLLWVALCWDLGVSASAQELADVVATPNRAIALSPDGQMLLVSYHPGRLSLLAVIDRRTNEFTLLHATDQRVAYRAQFVSDDRVWAFARQEEGCQFAHSQTMLDISLPKARRHQAIQLSERRHLIGSGAVQLSLHDRINQRIRQLSAQWGVLDQHDWPAARLQILPEAHCPMNWTPGYLILQRDDGTRSLYQPDRPNDLMLSGQQWLIDSQRRILAQVDSSGVLYRAGLPAHHLPGKGRWRLLGMTRSNELLMLGPGQARSASQALYRIGASDPELLFEPTDYRIDPARILMLNLDPVALYGSGEHATRLLLDSEHSDWIRQIESQIGPVTQIIGQSSDQTVRALATDSGFWLTEAGTAPRLLESVHPWFESPVASQPIQRTLQIATGAMLPGEQAGLSFSGIEVRAISGVESMATDTDCTWTRRRLDQTTTTTIDCGMRPKSWTSILSEERDDERLLRLQAMIRHILHTQANG